MIITAEVTAVAKVGVEAPAFLGAWQELDTEHVVRGSAASEHVVHSFGRGVVVVIATACESYGGVSITFTSAVQVSTV